MPTDLKLKEQLPELTARLVQTYRGQDAINHLGHRPLPQYEVVVSALEDLQEVLFPGYRRRQGLHSGNVAFYVGDLMDRLHDKLTTQIARALRHNGQRQAPDVAADHEAQGQAMAVAFLKRLPALREVLSADARAAYEGDPACRNVDEVVFCYPGLEAITVYRLAHELHLLGVPFIPRMMTEWAHQQTGIDLHPAATIGRHFFIDHGTGVVVGATCQIGDHVTLYQGVTLGALNFPTDQNGNLIRHSKRHPTIEDHVVVYANATVLGGDTTIGHHSVIGSSVWLTRSVDPYSCVTMVKPKLVERRTMQSGGASEERAA